MIDLVSSIDFVCQVIPSNISRLLVSTLNPYTPSLGLFGLLLVPQVGIRHIEMGVERVLLSLMQKFLFKLS